MAADRNELPQDVQDKIVALGRNYGVAGMLTMTDLKGIAILAYQRGREDERKAEAIHPDPLGDALNSGDGSYRP